MSSGHFPYCFFYILIRRFRFLCVYYINVVVFKHLARISFYFISVKHKDQRTFPVSLIVAQNIRQSASGSRNISVGKFF